MVHSCLRFAPIGLVIAAAFTMQLAHQALGGEARQIHQFMVASALALGQFSGLVAVQPESP